MILSYTEATKRVFDVLVSLAITGTGLGYLNQTRYPDRNSFAHYTKYQLHQLLEVLRILRIMASL